MEFVSCENILVHIFLNLTIQFVFCYIIFCATHHLFWTPIKLYVLAQIWSGCALKDHGEWAVVTGATDGIGMENKKRFYAVKLLCIFHKQTVVAYFFR